MTLQFNPNLGGRQLENEEKQQKFSNMLQSLQLLGQGIQGYQKNKNQEALLKIAQQKAGNDQTEFGWKQGEYNRMNTPQGQDPNWQGGGPGAGDLGMQPSYGMPSTPQSPNPLSIFQGQKGSASPEVPGNRGILDLWDQSMPHLASGKGGSMNYPGAPEEMQKVYNDPSLSPRQISEQQGRFDKGLEYEKTQSEITKNLREPATYGIPWFDASGNPTGGFTSYPGGMKPAPFLRPPPNEYDKATQKAEAKKAMNQPIEKRNLDSALAGFDRMIAEAQAIKAHPSLSKATGMSSFMGKIPATGAYNVRGRIDTLKSKTGFQVLQEMRQNSPTGGALGNISDSENRFLQENIANLDVGQRDEDFPAALDRVIEYARGAKQRLQKGYDEYYGEGGGGGGNEDPLGLGL